MILSLRSAYTRRCNIVRLHRCFSTANTVAASSPAIHVAVVGSGPSALYTSKYLLRAAPSAVVDIFESLPVPYGLVRFGVAPDHPEVKRVSEDFDGVINDARLRFFGNVTVGSDVAVDTLLRRYHAVVLAYGAQSDARLTIPNRHLKHIVTARQFVAFYNGHPAQYAADDVAQFALDNVKSVLIIGQGNVAIDCARVLLTPPATLAATDMTPQALAMLERSTINNVYLVGRRGPAQSAFTTAEWRELTSLANVDVRMRQRDFDDGMTANSTAEVSVRANKRKFDLIQQIHKRNADTPITDATRKTLHVHYLSSPKSYIPHPNDNSRVGGCVMERTRLVGDAHDQQAVGTGELETIEADFVLESIGYRSLSIQTDIPFDQRRHVIPSAAGRVIRQDGAVVNGLYVSGWLKRGATGIIGSNIMDAKETVDSIMADVTSTPSGDALDKSGIQTDDLSGIRYVDKVGWAAIDAEERRRGQAIGRERVKLTSVADMLDVATAANTHIAT